MNSPQPKLSTQANGRSAAGSNSPAPSSDAVAIRLPAPVFNFPHAQDRIVTQSSSGVGDPNSRRPRVVTLANRSSAAALNLPAPISAPVAKYEAARGLNNRRSPCLTD